MSDVFRTFFTAAAAVVGVLAVALGPKDGPDIAGPALAITWALLAIAWRPEKEKGGDR